MREKTTQALAPVGLRYEKREYNLEDQDRDPSW